MAGMLPGVECARRRRFHQSGIGGISDSPTISSGYGLTRRSSFCLYTSNHESPHLGSISSSMVQRSAQSQAYCNEKLGDAAREAKGRLDERLRAQWKSSSESKRVVSGQQRSRNYLQSTSSSSTTTTTMESRELQKTDEVFGMKKSRSKWFSWGKSSWKSAEQDECAVCLEQYKVGENLIHLPCAHRFHSRCLIPWLDKNQHCPCCRMDFQN